jgi:hypothetical protein
MIRFASMLLGSCLLLGCSGKPPEPKAPQARVATPFDQLQQAKQRAAAVQKTVDQQAQRQREQIEQAAQ